MPDARPQAAGVALIPCYNEGRNPIDLCAALLAVPDLDAIFIDDAGDDESSAVLRSLEAHGPRVAVVRNEQRQGKVASLLAAMRTLDPSVRRILLLDCDIAVDAPTIERVLREIDRSDFVLVNAVALAQPRTVWERGAIFSARRHERLRAKAFDRYPALCSNGRLLGMSRRLMDAIVKSDVPRHTEDAHFMLVCIAQGFTYRYLADARVAYRAPDTLEDYLRQSNRFSEGRSLLRGRWPVGVLERRYDPKPADLLVTFLAQAATDPAGALVFVTMLAAKSVMRRPMRSQPGTWAVSASTKSLGNSR